MKNEIIIISVLITAFAIGFSITSYDLFNNPIMESSMGDWGWTSNYCDKKSYVTMKLNGEITGIQVFHEYCNI